MGETPITRPHSLQWPLTEQQVEDLNATLDDIYELLKQRKAAAAPDHTLLHVVHTDTTPDDEVNGDLIVGQGGKFERFPIGANGDHLKVAAGAPVWSPDGSTLEDLNATEITSGTLDPARLALSGVTAGTYGDSTHVPQVTLDNKGRVTAAADVAIALPPTTHNLLSATHLDTQTASPAIGDLVVAQNSGAIDADAYWLDGLPFDCVPNASDAGTEAFWKDGLPDDGMVSTGAVTWARKANSTTPGYVLTAAATGPDWQPAGGSSGNTFASVYKAAAFVLADNTLTDVILDTVESDPLAFWSSGTPTRLTVPVAQGGLYLIEAEATWPTGFVGMMYVHIYVNGVKRASSPSSGGAGSNEQPQLASALVQLNSGDYVVATLQHIANAAGSSATIAGGVTKTRLQLGRLASESVVKSDLPSALAGALIQGNPSSTGYDRLAIGAAATVLLSSGAAAGWSTRPTLRDVAEAISAAWGFSANFTQYGRATKSMEKIDVAFAAGNFTGNGAMTWGVAVGDQLSFLYAMDGKFMFVTGYFNQTTVGGVADTDLRVAIPGGFVSDGLVVGSARVNAAGAGFAAGTVYVTVGGTTINFQTITGANWTLGVDNTAIQFSIFFPVQ